MTTDEARERIKAEFISRYREWLTDYNNKEMSERDYGWKYGWGRSSEELKDTQKTMILFQSHIFSGKYICGWKKDGIDLQLLVALHREGFLSYDYSCSSKARREGKTDFYYINQNKAKEIYKEYKSVFSN